MMKCTLLIMLGLWSSSLATDNQKSLNFSTANDVSVSVSSVDLPEVHIVGGTEARPNEFPWLVNLIVFDNSSSRSFCGGTLIELDLVLTAAHCLFGGTKKNPLPASQVQITAGDHNRRYEEISEQIKWATGVKVHESYRVIEPSNILKNDIALVKLETSFLRTQYVRPIGYASGNSNPAGNGTVAGWGTLYFGATTIPDTLRKVDVPIVSRSSPICSRLLSDPNSNLQFCAGTHGKDACQGDSGGPFICKSNPNVVCGIVSYGDGCAGRDKPGVYTNVAAYISWIVKNRNGTFSKTLPSSSAAISFESFLLVVAVLVLTVMPCRF